MGRRLAIRPAIGTDSAAVAAIYNREVEESTATMDVRPRTLEEQRDWITNRSGAYSAVVGIDTASGEVVGFASLSPYKERAAYNTTVEDSVYVHRDWGGRGIGTELLIHIVEVAKTSGFHSIIARIAADGIASRSLHERCGFSLVGMEHQVARKFGQWIDIAVYQQVL